MSYKFGSKAVQDGLIFYVDAANNLSYSSSGATWKDIVGDEDVTLGGSPTYSTDNGGNFDLDAVDDTASCNLDVTALSAFTLEAWVKPTSSTSDGTVMANFSGSISNSSYILYWDVGGALGFDFLCIPTSNNFSRTGVTPANGNINEWNHVVGTFDGSQIQLYVNNSLINTVSFSGTLRPLSGITIGNDSSSGNRRMDGNIALSKVYNKKLSAAEVSQNYNALKGRFI